MLHSHSRAAVFPSLLPALQECQQEQIAWDVPSLSPFLHLSIYSDKVKCAEAVLIHGKQRCKELGISKVPGWWLAVVRRMWE